MTEPANPGRTARRAPTTMLAVAAVALTALGLGGVGAAQAAPAGTLPATTVPANTLPATTGTDGWMRVAHLSPDTKSVDIKLSALSGGDAIVELTDVAYGAVSDYLAVPEGTYVVSMVPSDGAADAAPIVSASVRIEPAKTITVAAFGRNSDLETQVFTDDLTSPAAGEARIRLIQASTVTDSVDVNTSTGVLIADDATAGAATSYATVPAGPWELELTATGLADTASVDLADGSANTLFVLDNADGGLTVMSVLDSATVGVMPEGGVQTGGGSLATDGPLAELAASVDLAGGRG
ncbi:DUF4397 domain-containing protein [Marisediminicola senii]|uniref:DUF4397 domain-containing protein n=1 Tax=Marisediminicola senii TaxID=2711233 RepID=UPI0013EB43AA|nr:DUF4397 domain-containing protein [Marisediminicola senii]